MAGFIILVVLLSQAQNGRLRFPSPRFLIHPFLATFEIPWAASSGMASTIDRYLPTRGRMAATEPRAAFAEVLLRKAAMGVRREKVALSSGCKSRPATAPAGSNRSSYGGNEMAEAFGDACHKLVTARVCRP
jgi:hypothetical protein